MTIEEKAYDEAIRKELIQFIKNWKDPNNIGRPHDFPTLTRNVEQCDRYIAWLEKQASVGEIVSRCKTSWYNEGKIQGQIEGLSDEEKYQQGWHDALEKQGEQKPYDQRKECKDCQFNYASECKGYCALKRDEQKPADWSEEDETRLTNIIIMLKEGASHHFNKKDITKTVDWLKSIKDRVQPQPKQEWNEEDERTYKSIIYSFAHNYPLTIQQQEFVKSLKPKPKQEWSEEDKDYYDAIVGKLEVTQDDAALTDNQIPQTSESLETY